MIESEVLKDFKKLSSLIEAKDKKIDDLEAKLAEKDKEIKELKSNQTQTRKRLLPKNYDKLNIADKLRYKKKQVHEARIRLEEQQKMMDELDYELNKYKSLYAEKDLRHEICEGIRKCSQNVSVYKEGIGLTDCYAIEEIVLQEIENGEE